jgi:predicted phage baseplate assembly protein
MTLELPNLDDRSFQSLVDEAKQLIPEYCPEWTNHNLSDPGIALIELFAYLTEIALYRVNQLPDRLYTTLLNLVGVERRPAAAAHAELLFRFAGPLESNLVIPEGTVVGTDPGPDGDEITFSVDRRVEVEPPELASLAWTTAASSVSEHEDEIESIVDGEDEVACFRSVPPQAGDCFYLGFGASLASSILELNVTARAQGVGIEPDDPPIEWHAYNGEAWVVCPKLRDDTGGLNRNGVIHLKLPARHEPTSVGERESYWLRARLTENQRQGGGYHTSPRIQALKVTTIGAVAPASHATIVEAMMLGQSDGTAGQEFDVHPSVLPRRDHEYIEVRGGGQATRWDEVEDFRDSDERSAHVVWEEVDGKVRFGPRVGDQQGRPLHKGMVPAKGHEVWVTGYRWGGGVQGNVPAGQLRRLQLAIPGVDSVVNPEAATGGADAETVEDLKISGPLRLRAAERAVTRTDYELLARQGAPSVARVRCAPPNGPGEPIRLLVVPQVGLAPEDLRLDALAITPEIVADVRTELDQVRTMGAEIEVTTPYYQGVTVVAEVSARPVGRASGEIQYDDIRRSVQRELYRFLSPIEGGWERDGWRFDADLSTRDLEILLAGLPGVRRVEDLALFEVDLRGGPERTGQRIGLDRDVVPLATDSLFMSFQHQVVVRRVAQ